MNATFKIVGGAIVFGLIVWGLVFLVLTKSDHYAQQHKFEKTCQHDGLFLEYKGGSITNCINRDHKIIRQYVR